MNEPSVLETARLRLLPSHQQHFQALRHGAAAFTELFGLSVADGLADFLQPEGRDAMVAAEWDGFLIVHRGDAALIGFCAGRKFPDANGAVEIAYGIAPGFQGRGLATEAARTLTEHALLRADVQAVIALTLPEFNASARVLAKCGFVQAGETTDPDAGRSWQWKLSRPPAAK